MFLLICSILEKLIVCSAYNLKKLTSSEWNWVSAADVMIEAADRAYWAAAEAEKMSLSAVIRFWTSENCCEVLTADWKHSI